MRLFRMPMSAALFALPVLAVSVFASPAAQAAGEVKAVATFSILGDMVSRIGGDRVAVSTLVGPNGDAHVYQPTPSDAKTLAAADVLVSNGLGFEGWMTRLTDSAGYKGPIIAAAEGIAPRKMEDEDEGDHADEHDHDHEGHDHADHDHGDHDHDHADHAHGHHHHGGVDPHAWQSVANAKQYARAIAEGLGKVDPQGRTAYDANLTAYLADLDALEAEIKTTIAAVPQDRRRIITSHDAFGYFADAYGVTFIAPQGVSTEAEASAGDVAMMIRQIREQKIPAVFVENVSDRRLIEQIARETGAKIGGTLYSDALSDPSGPAGTYLNMMRFNLRSMSEALKP